MRTFSSTEEVQRACLPSWQHEAVAEAVGIMENIFGQGFGTQHGFVVLIEAGDTSEATIALLGYHINDKLETTWRRHGCLIGLTLWGNSGDGVTWICPERPGYAPQIQDILLGEL